MFKGAKSCDLHIEQPTKFELVINLRTVRALNVTITPSLMLWADQVIDERERASTEPADAAVGECHQYSQ